VVMWTCHLIVALDWSCLKRKSHLAGFPICAESVHYVNTYILTRCIQIHTAGSCWWWLRGTSIATELLNASLRRLEQQFYEAATLVYALKQANYYVVF